MTANADGAIVAEITAPTFNCTLRNLAGQIDRLQAATDAEVQRLAASIPGWIEQIKNCTARRRTEEQGRLQELEREMAVFKGVERQVRQHVREIHACIASARAQRELLQAHFHSSRSQGQRSSRSLVDMKNCLAGLISKIEVNLAELDAALQDMEQQLAAAAAGV